MLWWMGSTLVDLCSGIACRLKPAVAEWASALSPHSDRTAKRRVRKCAPPHPEQQTGTHGPRKNPSSPRTSRTWILKPSSHRHPFLRHSLVRRTGRLCVPASRCCGSTPANPPILLARLSVSHLERAAGTILATPLSIFAMSSGATSRSSAELQLALNVLQKTLEDGPSSGPTLSYVLARVLRRFNLFLTCTGAMYPHHPRGGRHIHGRVSWY